MKRTHGINTIFYGPTDKQAADMKRAEDIEVEFTRWVHDGNRTLEEAKSKYAELKGSLK